MIEYLDRTPDQLSPLARSVVMALRSWLRDRRSGVVPPSGIRRALRYPQDHAAALIAHALFVWLGWNGRRPIVFGCPCCGRLSDDEALILAATFAANEHACRAGLLTLVHVGAVDEGVWLARRLAAALQDIVNEAEGS